MASDLQNVIVGRLPTLTQDEYPGLGAWWVQLRIGPSHDEVLARVYGSTPMGAKERAEKIAFAINGSHNLSIEGLAQEIRRVDGNHDLGAVKLAEALMPYLERTFIFGNAYIEDEDEGPEGEDGPWAKGWEKRSVGPDQVARAKAMYGRWTDNRGIHCNRFPAWEELGLDAQNEWIAKAKNICPTCLIKEKRVGSDYCGDKDCIPL